MTSRHVRQVCAAAIAVASGALLPTTAEAHCIGPAGLADTPTAAQLTDFSGDYGGCTSRFSAYSAGFATASNSMFRPPASGKKGAFKLVGRNPLLHRGMNAAIAIKGDYAYIGSRTDLHPGTPHGGVMVLDISRPNQPELLGQPIAAMAGESTRELRVWQSQNVLIVLNTNCGVGDKLHHCTTASVSNIRFYDIAGRNAKYARRPSLVTVSECRPPVVKPCGPVNRVTGGLPSRIAEMSQTENGQLGAPPRVPHVEPALPANTSARPRCLGSSHRKNSCVSTSNWCSSRGRSASRPEMS